MPDCDPEEYLRRTPKVPWGDRKPVTEFYRFVNREMIGPSAERTLIPVILPKKVAHVNTSISTIFLKLDDLLDYYSMALSCPVDFRVKTTGMGHANVTLISQLPLISRNIPHKLFLHIRALSLTCLTVYYSELWSSCWKPEYRQDRWTKDDPRLPNSFFENLTPEWNRDCALRTDYARRQALVEIDVLVAMALGLTLNELKTIYRVQFPVLRQYEADTWYDQKGRIVFTCSKGLTGVGFSRDEWKRIKDMKSGTIERPITDDTLPDGPRERTIVYYAPFDRCDRERDYEIAWKAFEERI